MFYNLILYFWGEITFSSNLIDAKCVEEVYVCVQCSSKEEKQKWNGMTYQYFGAALKVF